MFFLARCIFWIVLVFVCLPSGPGGRGAGALFLDLAGASAASMSRARLAPATETATDEFVDRGADWCKAHGEACVDAVLAAMVTKYPETASSRTVSRKAVGTGTPGLLERAVRFSSPIAGEAFAREALARVGG